MAPQIAADTKALADYGVPTVTNTELQDALAAHVRERFTEAANAKTSEGITSRLLRNLRANKCVYQPGEQELLDGNDVYIGICALKARGARSWLNDIILNNIDKPWAIQPTPIPDIPERDKEHVINQLITELPRIMNMGQLRSRARELKTIAIERASEIAERANKKMEMTIADQLAEGGWKETFGTFIDDLTVYPNAFIRGPFEINKPHASWKDNKYTTENKTLPTVRTISPFDAFPAPNAVTPQKGDYFIERYRFSYSDLYELVNVEGFDSFNLRTVLNLYPNGYQEIVVSDAERDRLEGQNQGLVVPRLIDTLIYNGRIPGHLLADKGILVPDPQKHYECEVWVVNNYVIRAVLNPSPLGTRPIYTTSFRKVGGSFWGDSVIDLVYDTQRICNSTVRSLVRNMGYSSGPFLEVVADRLADGEDPRDLTPYKVFLVTPDIAGTGQPAIRMDKVQSIAPDLIGVFDRFLKVADDLSGVPAYVLGNPNVAGAGRTLGGLSMLMGNAAKGIKDVQLNIDRDVIDGVITGFYQYNMQVSNDTTIKADAKVVARGATGLLQRELAQARTVEILQLLTPYIENWEQLPDGIKVLLREVLKSTGLPVDDIISDPLAGREIAARARELGQAEAFSRGASSPQPLPPQSVPPAISGATVPLAMAQGA